MHTHALCGEHTVRVEATDLGQCGYRYTEYQCCGQLHPVLHAVYRYKLVDILRAARFR